MKKRSPDLKQPQPDQQDETAFTTSNPAMRELLDHIARVLAEEWVRQGCAEQNHDDHSAPIPPERRR